MKRNVFVTTISILLAVFGRAVADEIPTSLVKASLVPEVASIQPGTPFWVAVRLEMAEGWHVNWLNPGDAGVPPTVDWRLPKGFEVGPLQWPYPSRFDLPELSIFGYEKEVLLLTQITPPRVLGEESLNLGADVTWLACREACIPGKASLDISLPVRKSTAVYNRSTRQAFRKTRGMLPSAESKWSFQASIGRHKIVITATPPGESLPELGDVTFFPEELGLIDCAAPQELKKKGRYYHLEVPRASIAPEPPDRIVGVLVSKNGWGPRSGKALEIDVPVK